MSILEERNWYELSLSKSRNRSENICPCWGCRLFTKNLEFLIYSGGLYRGRYISFDECNDNSKSNIDYWRNSNIPYSLDKINNRIDSKVNVKKDVKQNVEEDVKKQQEEPTDRMVIFLGDID